MSDNGDSFQLFFGLKEHCVKQFTDRSCDFGDTELHRFTTDYKRICEGGYEAWYAKERYPFGLIAADETLAGIIWFGPKEFPGLIEGVAPTTNKPWHTFAIRLYPPYRGKRLALPFAEVVFAEHAKLFPGFAVWLDTQNENEGAIRLYQKLGFVACGQKANLDGSGDGRLVMARV